MSQSSVSNQPLRLLQCVLKIRRAVHCQYGRQFFVRELLRRLNRSHLAYQDFCVPAHLNPRKRRDVISRSADYFRVQRAVYDYGFSDLLLALGA